MTITTEEVLAFSTSGTAGGETPSPVVSQNEKSAKAEVCTEPWCPAL